MTRSFVALVLATTLAAPAIAQSTAPGRVTSADYDRGAKFLAQNVGGLVVGGVVAPVWLNDGRFWYRNSTPSGVEIVVIDPKLRRRETCPANATQCAGVSIDEKAAAASARAGFGGGGGGRGGNAGPRSSTGAPLTVSPDGRRGVFIRDWNVWVHDVASGQEKPLTTDGVKDFGYATDNAGWSSSDRAMVSWSPDSRRIATQQQDERRVGEMYLVSTTVGHPTLRVSKFPLPGDSVMAMLQRVVIDVDAGSVTRLHMPPDYHRGTLGDDIRMGDYVWNPDGSKLAIASVSRDHKRA